MAANVPASRAPAPGHNDYTIGWIAALPVEFAAARAMLTHRHKRLPVAAGDSNAYFLGSIGDHNIAIACINEAGGLPASIVASNMVKTFPSVRYVRMVGIGGGIRSEKYPIQLGDIVVSEPSGIFGGVVQSDYGKWEPDGFKRTGSLNRPADGLIRAIGAWRALYYSGESQIHRYVKHLPSGLLHPPGAWVYQGTANDPCYNKDDDCGCTTACEECEARTPDPQVHYGIIASGNQVIKSERQRNWIRDELGACCVEMEAFGLMNSFPCLTIRGISDYADGRKNDLWQPYAALTAAAYAKELLLQLAAVAVDSTPNIIDQLGQLGETLSGVRQQLNIETERAAEERQEAQQHRTRDEDWKFKQDWQHSRNECRALYSSLTENGSLDALSWAINDKALLETHQETCTWLYDHAAFKEWSESASGRPVLWLHGHHGVGKTCLCATAIHRLQKQCPPKTAIARYFVVRDEIPSRNRILRSIAAQLLHCLADQVKNELPAAIDPYLNINHKDTTKVENLIEALLKELPRTFIFVDGLDEAEYAEDVSDFEYCYRDVQDVVRLLLAKAAECPATVRLWCSSQDLPTIRKYLKENNARDIRELPVQVKEVQADIMRYLSSAMPATHGNSGLPQAFIRATLETEVEGSFLWAKHMLNEIQSSADDDDDMLNLVTKGLPSKMSDLYEKILERVEKRGNGKQLPLWRVVLSLVTFARRPLKVVEVIEAVAIARSEQHSNLNDRKIVTRDKVLGSCLSLVHCIGTKDGSDKEVLRLSHSSVRKFLLSFSWNGRDVVSSAIIRMCCLRYVLQPRYSQPLRIMPFGVSTAEGDDIRTHRLLVYAAKYWHQHCDSPRGGGLGPDERNAVVGFLKSSNFLTIMQVQSFFVVGHFLQNFDPITDQENTIRRTMPDWIMSTERHLDRQYRLFQSEWCHLLQSKSYARFNGQLERCFWQSLGPGNFLSHNKSRYRSFQFGVSKDRGEGVMEKSCQMFQCSSDGKRFMTCFFQSRNGLQQLQLQHWALVNSNLPKLTEQSTITMPSERSRLDLYPIPWTNKFMSMPLIPNYRSFMSPEPVFLNGNGSMIRIGAMMFQRSSNTPLETRFIPFENKSIKDSWDGVVSCGPFSIFYRRSKPRPAEKAPEREREIRRVRATRERLVAAQERSRSNSRGGSPADGDSESGCDSGFGGLPDCPSADESWGDDHSGAGEGSSDGILSEDPGEENEDQISVESYPPSSCPSDLESPESSTNSDRSDSESIKSDASIDSSSLESFGSETGSIESSISENSSLGYDPVSPDAETHNQVYIEGLGRGPVECDWCYRESIPVWYYCIICEDANFDICERCEWRGRWCLDIKHQLYRFVKGKPAGVISRRSFDIQQEVAVLHNSQRAPKIVFHIRKRYRDVIYGSPPVIHPVHALMVWPLSGTRLLFADIKENRYFEYPLRRIGVKKAHSICIELSFSSCGSLLRLAAIDTTSQKPLSRKVGLKPTLCLRLHILLLRLSSSSPTRTAPTLHASKTVSLPCSNMKPFVTTLPFAFTWTPEELYLTISSTFLHVYRIGFPKVKADPTSDVNKELRVQTPIETILLPRSSRTRSVQFFPGSPPDNIATAIIGPRYGKHPSSAIGVYLTQRDLGGWKDVHESVTSRTECVPEHRLAGQFEDFDAEEDCDIIPFDN